MAAHGFTRLLPRPTPLQDYGNPERSGKLLVVAKVLRHWHDAGHK